MMSAFYKFEFELNKICFILELSSNSENHDYNSYTRLLNCNVQEYLLKTHQLEKHNNKGSRKNYFKDVNRRCIQ